MPPRRRPPPAHIAAYLNAGLAVERRVADLASMDNLDQVSSAAHRAIARLLFGQRPFTGKLPMIWPRSEDQVPINIGDADYNPLFPLRLGLRTDKVGWKA
jgi:hypothetical protein